MPNAEIAEVVLEKMVRDWVVLLEKKFAHPPPGPQNPKFFPQITKQIATSPRSTPSNLAKHLEKIRMQ